jgi:hypothetical protein
MLLMKGMIILGTSGAYGFHKKGIDKITFNKFDSNPSFLGENIVSFIMNNSISEMNDVFERIILVDDKTKPTEEQISECEDYFEDFYGMISNMSKDNWYALLFKVHGRLSLYKNDLKYMIDNNETIKESVYCQWGYVINLDSNELEVYIGGQREPQNNRYKVDTPDKYGFYNCKLFKSIPFDKIDENTMDNINEEYEKLREVV